MGVKHLEFWRRRVVSTHQVSHSLNTDPKTAKFWYVKRYGKAPSLRLGWTSKEVAALRADIRRRQTTIATWKLATALHVNRCTIEVTWHKDGLRLPQLRNHIGKGCRSRQWTQRDIKRLWRWLQARYPDGNNLDDGRHLSPEFFELLKGEPPTREKQNASPRNYGSRRSDGRNQSASSLRVAARS